MPEALLRSATSITDQAILVKKLQFPVALLWARASGAGPRAPVRGAFRPRVFVVSSGRGRSARSRSSPRRRSRSCSSQGPRLLSRRVNVSSATSRSSSRRRSRSSSTSPRSFYPESLVPESIVLARPQSGPGSRGGSTGLALFGGPGPDPCASPSGRRSPSSFSARGFVSSGGRGRVSDLLRIRVSHPESRRLPGSVRHEGVPVINPSRTLAVAFSLTSSPVRPRRRRRRRGVRGPKPEPAKVEASAPPADPRFRRSREEVLRGARRRKAPDGGTA